MLHKLGLMDRDQRGFTIIELLIAFTIAALVAIGVTAGVFQIVTGNTRTSNHMTAVRQVQEAGYWVSHDTQMAQSVETDNLTEPEILELTWAEWDTSYKHLVIYSLTNMNGGLKQLVRQHLTYDADDNLIDSLTSTSIVAQFIDPALTSCIFIDNELIFTVTATVSSGSQQGSETRVYKISPRPTV